MEAVRGPMSVQKSMAGSGVRILTPDRFFAHAGRADPQLSRRQSAGEVACLRTDQPRQCCRRREAGFRRAGRDTLRLFEGGRYRFARRRLPLRRIPWLRALYARLRRAPQSRCEHEPAVRDREHAEFDGNEGGSPVAGASGGNRKLGLCAGQRRWRKGWWNCRRRAEKFVVCDREGSASAQRFERRHGWRSSATCGSCAGTRHQRSARQCRQDGLLHRSRGRQSSQPQRVVCTRWSTTCAPAKSISC